MIGKTLPQVFLLILFFMQVHAQSDSSRLNAVYLELIGSTAAFSINYDRIVLQTENLDMSLRAGVLAVPAFMTANKQSVAGLTGGINILWGDRDRGVLGIGYTRIWEKTSPFNERTFSSIAYFKGGYRRVFGKHIYFDASFLVYLYARYDIDVWETLVLPGLGASIGYAF